MITFKKAMGQGFGSLIKPTEFKYNRPGLNIVIGETGDGKTTFFSLIVWVLYGMNLKGSKNVTTWTHKQGDGFMGTIGWVKFEKDGVKYKVIRTQDYKGKVEGGKLKNGIIILIDGVASDKRNKTDKQEQIVEILGYTRELFVNAIIFGQKMKRLIEETGPGKKKIFEEAFEAGFIEEGRKKAEADLKIKVAEFDKVDRENLIFTKDIQALEDKIEFTSKAKKDFIAKNKGEQVNRAIRIVGLEKKIKEADLDSVKYVLHKERINSTREELAKLDWSSAQKVEDEYNLLRRQVKGKEEEVECLGSEIDSYRRQLEKIPKTCNVCGAPLSKEANQKRIKSIKKSREKARSQLQISKDDLKELKVAFKKKNKELASLIPHKHNRLELTQLIKKLENELDEHQTLKVNVSQWEDQIADYRKDIDNLKKEKPTFKVKPLLKSLEELKNKHRKTEKLHRQLKKEIDGLKWVISDALGNKGLKSYIFDTSLRNLNHRLVYYEQFIGYRVEFKVDLDSPNKDIYTVCYEGDNMVPYEDLSGGQNQQVNIVTAFAMNDMVTDGKPVNLIVLDEVFENLGQKCTDLVFDLINEKSRDKCLFLITHKLDLQSSGDKVIRVRMDAAGQTHTKWV